MGLYGDDANSKEEITKRFFNTLASLEDRFTYYDGSEMKVNFALNQYLGDVLKDLRNGIYERSKTLAMTICGMGNKNGTMEFSESVDAISEEAHFILSKLMQFYEGTDDLPIDILRAYVHKLEYLDKVLELTDVFVTCKLGAVYGAPEYSEAALQEVGETPDPDFDVDGLECKQDADCTCGCVMDHPMMVIDGMEDFLNGVESPAREYFIGVAGANNIRLEGYAGQEGPIFDAIKDLGEKAWNALTASLSAIKDLFTTSNPEEKVKSAETMADNNKKALQSMKSTAAVIND
jgi:hypothetical protein